MIGKQMRNGRERGSMSLVLVLFVAIAVLLLVVPGVASASTNLFATNIANGCEDGTTTGFVVMSGATLTSSTAQARQGTHSLKVVTPNVGAAEGADTGVTWGLTPLTQYSESVYVYGSGTACISLIEYSSGSGYIGQETNCGVTFTSSWQRVTLTRTFGATGDGIKMEIFTPSKQAATFYADALQLQTGAGTAPVASFTIDRSGIIRIPRTVTFTDTSTSIPTTWVWDFGDGSA
jgi:hypothetical protein